MLEVGSSANHYNYVIPPESWAIPDGIHQLRPVPTTNSFLARRFEVAGRNRQQLEDATAQLADIRQAFLSREVTSGTRFVDLYEPLGLSIGNFTQAVSVTDAMVKEAYAKVKI